MEIHVGMTGSRNGMTLFQKNTFANILRDVGAHILHHGDCIGADADAHDLAQSKNILNYIHPPIKDELRAYKAGQKIYTEKNYFARNRDIVDETTLLIGVPGSFSSQKGGTWYTIQYGMKQGKPVHIIWPDGSVKIENNPQA